MSPEHVPQSPLTLAIDAAALKPLIAAVIAETVAVIQDEQAKLGDRLAYSEEEAARLLGLEIHQLRDERRRGRIACSQVVGRRIRYLREDLTAYLMARRLNQQDR